MPTLVTLGNLKVHIFFGDTDRHQRPHFHVRTPEGRAVVAIDDLGVLESDLPDRKIKMALDWAVDHREALIGEWNRCNPNRTIEES